MPAGPVQYSLDGNIARILFDDGKANALSHDALDALNDALDRAASEANCVLWLGRPGRFSAGFDLTVMSQGRRAITELVAKGAKLALRVYESPVPVVLGVTGHALAMGAILLMAADRRIGTAGNFKIGLNEVAIGMTLPDFGIEFAKARLHPAHLTRSVVNAWMYRPEDAIEAGYIDRVVAASDLETEAQANAEELAGLDRAAYGATKKALNGDTMARVRSAISAFEK